ncbi:MAG: nucleotide exchange factor GrpE [Paludisphaera borealis]|uniref:nucleotide exchange factor GrpE n=1 Tax=Paludisphaera borealis TaxID=1387353 RepID=UPI00283E00DA|nr:nucleotide exchange factor GrpE [Paludisphaera borealis]MDR3622949.1 nucleotide exchange factor GrpE [Paludisphaera borealis]
MPDPVNLTEDVPPTPDDDEAFGLDLEIPAEVVAAILEPEAEPEPEPITEQVLVEPDNDVRRAVDRLGDRIDQRLAGLQAQFDREVRAEASRERVVDRLHAELQEYKQDLLLKVQRPIFVDLIQLHDDVGKMAEAQGDDGEAVRGMLESIQTAVEDILYRQGVEPFRNDGEAFDPRRQRAVTTTPTDEPDRAKTVAQRLRPGFQAGDKVIRPEIVTVYTLKP